MSTPSDSYAWLHDTSSPRTYQHLRSERARYDQAVMPLMPLVQQLTQEMFARLPIQERSPRWTLNKFSYYTQQKSDTDYADLVQVDIENNSERVIFSPNALVAQGASYLEIGIQALSPDETLLAYSVDTEGNELYQLRFRDLASGADLADRIEGTYYGGAWTADGSGFLYTTTDAAYRPHQVWWHRLGTDRAEDVLLFTETDERFEVCLRSPRAFGSGLDWIIVWSESNTTSECWLLDGTDPSAPLRSAGGRQDRVRYHVEPRAAQRDLLIVSDRQAPEGALYLAPVPPLTGQDDSAWKLARPEDPEEQLLRVDAFAGGVVAQVRHRGELAIRVLSHTDLAGSALAGPGALVGPPLAHGDLELGENPDYLAESVVLQVQAHAHPPSYYAVHLASAEVDLLIEGESPTFRPEEYETQRLLFPSGDGTLVPTIVINHRDFPLSPKTPALIFAYGAYGYCWPAEWEPALPSVLDRGVAYVHAHVRGGGELGRSWYEQGKLRHKQNTFSDLIGVAGGLAEQGLVDPNRIATRGLSAGGLLQGAVFSQRPDLWAAVVAEVPFVDVVTTMLDPETPLTVTEWEEWGDPRVPEQRAWLAAYSPYENLPPAGQRPALLVTGAVNDPRVMVREPAKWVAALRDSDPGWADKCLFRCEVGAGAHVGPSGRRDHLRYEAEVYAWLLTQLGVVTQESNSA